MKRMVAIGVVGAVALAACSSGSSAAKPKAVAKVTTTTTKPPPVAPLTGLADPTGIAQTRSLVSIKIDNDTYISRPQTGIDQADIVWDEVVEGEATRFLAMFQSQTPDVVGPVRSVRRTDPLIVWPYGGIFAYSGGAKYAVDAISLAPVKRVDESAAGSAMFRDSSRKPPHNLYAHPAQLFTLGGVPAPPPPVFDYAKPSAVTPGVRVVSVHLGFAGQWAPTYTWEPGNGVWLRSTNAGPFVVKSGKQIAPQNVVVLSVVYAGGVGVIGAEAQLVGRGPAKVFTNGREIDGAWVRAAKTDRIALIGADGKPILLTPGQTWVELPNTTYSIDVVPVPLPATTSSSKPAKP